MTATGPSPDLLDPSLLLELDALLREKHVTRAARALGRSQPAMSNALKRLRAQLGDPLLVQAKGRMVLMERARDLARPAAEAVAQMRRVFAPAGVFDPVTTTRTFCLATSDYLEQLGLPRLVGRFARAAPGATLRVRRHAAVVDGLLEGEIDVAVGGYVSNALPPGLHRRLLVSDRVVCVLRRGHPAARALDLRTYAGLVHIVVSRGTGVSTVDELLAERGLTRRVGVHLPQFTLAPALVAATDYVLVVSERLARAAAAALPLEIVEPPLPLPTMKINALWHERAHHEPAHRWFRDLVRRAWADPEGAS